MVVRVGLWRKLNAKELILFNYGVGEDSWDWTELNIWGLFILFILLQLFESALYFYWLVKICCSVQSLSCVQLFTPHGLKHTSLPCPSPSPRARSNSGPLSPWYHPTISSSVIPFSSCSQSSPALESFPVSQFFASGGQSFGTSTSASVLPMNIQD